MPKIYGKRKQTPDLEQAELYDKITKLETDILSEIEYLNKKRNQKFDCVHCYTQPVGDYDPAVNYYEKFWKQYMINAICLERYQVYKEWVKKIGKKIKNIEKIYEQRRVLVEPIESKKGRKKVDIRDFECQECGKKYKDQASLELHMSIKHRQEQIHYQAKMEELNPIQYHIAGINQQQQNYYSEEDEKIG